MKRILLVMALVSSMTIANAQQVKDIAAAKAAVEAAQATHIDLIHPIPANDIIFQVVPFPHGEELLGQTNIAFDMSAAQEAIINYRGTHTFTMNVTDIQGCKKSISIVMVVK